jgi:hypothetical protein
LGFCALKGERPVQTFVGLSLFDVSKIRLFFNSPNKTEKKVQFFFSPERIAKSYGIKKPPPVQVRV